MSRKPNADTHMPTYIKDRCELAVIYAEDGAYASAAKVLTQLALEVEAHSMKVRASLAALLGSTRK